MQLLDKRTQAGTNVIDLHFLILSLRSPYYACIILNQFMQILKFLNLYFVT